MATATATDASSAVRFRHRFSPCCRPLEASVPLHITNLHLNARCLLKATSAPKKKKKHPFKFLEYFVFTTALLRNDITWDESKNCIVFPPVRALGPIPFTRVQIQGPSKREGGKNAREGEKDILDATSPRVVAIWSFGSQPGMMTVSK